MHAALFSPLFFLGILLLQEAFVQVQALQGKPRMPGSHLGVPLEGTRRVGGLLGVAGRLSGTVSPFTK